MISKQLIIAILLVKLSIVFYISWVFISIRLSNIKNTEHDFQEVEKKFSDKQIELSKIIYAEANQSDVMDMYLIGSVVLNRTNCSSDFPNTIDSVIYQSNQFCGVKSKNFGKRTPATDKVVEDLYNGIGRVYDVCYFYNPKYATDSVFINWANTQKIKAMSSGHIFF